MKCLEFREYFVVVCNKYHPQPKSQSTFAKNCKKKNPVKPGLFKKLGALLMSPDCYYQSEKKRSGSTRNRTEDLLRVKQM